MIRPKNVAEAELMTVAVPKFKARPLNKKILNAPSLPLRKRTPARFPEFQEFHLKTSERVVQHTFATSSSTLPCNDSDKFLLPAGFGQTSYWFKNLGKRYLELCFARNELGNIFKGYCGTHLKCTGHPIFSYRLNTEKAWLAFHFFWIGDRKRANRRKVSY